MGVFNFFIIILQILTAGIFGTLVKKLLESETIFALALGCISMIVADLLNLIVDDK